ncbi:Pentatricopeptide repeat-containing protein, partial [Ananas comosus]
EMEREGSARPNAVTFLALLCACSHAGMLDEALGFFDAMQSKYDINPGVEHYGCLVDILGRLGRIEHARKVIDEMPVRPDARVWGALLSACRTRGDIPAAVTAIERLVELEPGDGGNYVILSNTYAAARRWDDVARTRREMRRRGVGKRAPGCSAIEVGDEVREFVAGGDWSDPVFGVMGGVLDHLARDFDLMSYP